MRERGPWKQDAEPGGIRLRRLNILMILLAAALAVVLLYASYQTAASYSAMLEATETYIACQQDAADMKAASDYLTDQVRYFTVTGELAYMDRFFTELQTTRRRENALADLESRVSDTEAVSYLTDALGQSNTLVQREVYAMRLTCEGRGYALSSLPAALRETALSEADSRLSSEAQQSLAISMVFDETYSSQKNQINQDVSECLDLLLRTTREEHAQSSTDLLSRLRQQEFLVAVLLIMFFAMVFLTSRLVIRPMMAAISYIRRQEELPLDGSYELRFLAETYNRIFRQNRENQDKLSYEAEHDALTGLYNRSAFEKLRSMSRRRSSALLLVDVDKFKTVNDTYGHDVGDRVLQKVASILRSSFRAEDRIFRIGGDEFAIIMTHAGQELADLVERKIRDANRRLQNPEDGLPPVSLSVGVAFGDRPDPTEDIYKDADTALYQVKNSTRAGCAFYGTEYRPSQDASEDDAYAAI